MDNDKSKELLIQFLRGGLAYHTMKDLIENFPEDKINKKIPGVDYTPYQLMEHLRIAQWDILEFVKDQNYQSLDWPNEFWPDKSFQADLKDWDKSVKQFFTDLNELEEIIKDENLILTDLLHEHNSFSYLREVLLVIAHNSYHLGQLMLLSKTE